MALSLGLVAGLDPGAIFAPVLSPLLADIAGSTLMLCLSAGFMAGRLTLVTGSVSAFWRDLTLTCAVLLTYSSLSRPALPCAARGKKRSTHAASPFLLGANARSNWKSVARL